MKRLLLPLLLPVCLLCLWGVPAAASPLTPAEGGSFTVFGEYASDAYIYSNETSEDAFVLGVGYGFSDALTLGLEVQYHDEDWILWGAFANLRLGDFLVNTDVFYEGTNDLFIKLAGLYAFEVDAFRLALGGGVMWAWDFDETFYFAEISGGWDLGDSCTVYGSVDYNFDEEWTTFKAGLAFAF